MRERLKGSKLSCGQCARMIEKQKSFLPQCADGRCSLTGEMGAGCEVWLLFWSMLRKAKTVPRALLLKRAGITSDADLELMLELDAQFAIIRAEMREQKRVR